ncbi:MAG: diguanylate cyclase, partial [Sulfitobacter pontiacus]
MASSSEPETPDDALLVSVGILAPRGRDAAVAGQLLDQHDIASTSVASLGELAGLIGRQIGAILV